MKKTRTLYRTIGDVWAKDKLHLLLKVPSARMKNEFIHLMHLYIEYFHKVKCIAMESSYFDSGN
jgi:hypothetical protein